MAAAKELRLATFLSIVSLIVLSGPSYSRTVPTSPLSDERANQLVLEKLELAAAKAKDELHQPVRVDMMKDWRLRSLWVSVTGKEPTNVVVVAAAGAGDEVAINPDQAYDDEARQVPGGPDPLHHSNQPTSP